MARQSKRKRDGRRFGVPERLADRLLEADWMIRPGSLDEHEGFLAECVASPVIVADDVVEYFLAHPEKEWKWLDLPACRLPFPSLFVEAKASLPDVPFDRIGVHFADADPARLLDELVDFSTTNFAGSRLLSDLPMLRDRCRSLVDFGAFLSDARNGRLVQFFRGSLFLGESGELLRSPAGQIDSSLCGTPEDVLLMKGMIWNLFFPVVLSLGFLNCKNVSIAPVDPPAILNRERRKAGLRPFVRYHVLNIEPMKRVLRTEGNAEATGLKRALHICRGHFSTYTPEKPLFGRVAGTFWVPAHARGSLEAGIVAKDYRVKAPANH